MKNAISVEKLSFEYLPGKTILDIDTLKIETGEKVFLYGPSGYGKSTLLNILAGVLEVKSGHVSVLGNQLETLSSHKKDRFRGSSLGYIFQSFNLIPYLSTMENIILPCRINKERKSRVSGSLEKRAIELAEELQLLDQVHQSVGQLSIGQQQRVAAARALIGSPELIIADEPTSSLDEKNTELFMNLLIKEWEQQKFTLLFVSHDQRLAKYFDRTISLPEVNKVVVD